MLGFQHQPRADEERKPTADFWTVRNVNVNVLVSCREKEDPEVAETGHFLKMVFSVRLYLEGTIHTKFFSATTPRTAEDRRRRMAALRACLENITDRMSDQYSVLSALREEEATVKEELQSLAVVLSPVVIQASVDPVPEQSRKRIRAD